jgi:hypothetical protein
MAGTGFGQMILPQIVRILLMDFGFRGCVLIVGSLSLHGLVGACFFQPVEWHLKKKKSSEELSETEPLLGPSSSSQPSAFQPFNEENFCTRLSKSMDLSLLKDFRFLLLNFGLACVYTVSIDFTLILPFFLQVNLFLFSILKHINKNFYF